VLPRQPACPRNCAGTRTCQTRDVRVSGAGRPRRLNDLDETLPGPFEYDVKRMAAGFTIAARNNGFTDSDAHDVTLSSVTAYREAMAEFAQMRTLDVWYAGKSERELSSDLQEAAKKQKRKVVREAAKESEGD
jgi:uncharacterized protein (DUF2252 family)